MKKNNIITIVVVCISIFYFLNILFQNRNIYLHKFDYKIIKSTYNQSQWNQSQNFSESVELEKWATTKGYTGWNNYVDENKIKTNIDKIKLNIINEIKKRGISDAQLYTYVGYEYIKGKDPTLLNPEHPPIGKYLIGLSIILFQNEHIILVITSVTILILLYFLIFVTTSSHVAASLVVLLTTTNSLFIDQMIHGPQLDIFQLLFFIPLLVFLYYYQNKKSFLYLFLGGICFGLLISTKTFISYYVLFNIWIIFYFFFQKKNVITFFKNLIFFNITGLCVFFISYLSFFLQGGNLKKFLGVQKYIFLFYHQSGINPLLFLGNYLRLIFTGSWKFWSQGNPISSYEQWNIFWIIIYLVGTYACFKMINQKVSKKDPLILSLLIFSVVYNIFLFIFPIFPRYLLLLFVSYNMLISIYFISSVTK